MDRIQKKLVELGRKDLAQEYYKKTVAISTNKKTAAAANTADLFTNIKRLIEQSINLADERKEYDVSAKLNSASGMLNNIQKLIFSMVTNVNNLYSV